MDIEKLLDAIRTYQGTAHIGIIKDALTFLSERGMLADPDCVSELKKQIINLQAALAEYNVSYADMTAYGTGAVKVMRVHPSEMAAAPGKKSLLDGGG